jgi:hypothetical protein
MVCRLPKESSELHAHRPCSQISCSVGQCMNGAWSYPISRKKCMRSFPAKSAAAIECTGASPQRYFTRHVLLVLIGEEGVIKRRRYLVVKSTATVEVLEECRIGLAAPKVHIGYLKIAPNCYLTMPMGQRGPLLWFDSGRKKDVQWQRL